MLAASDRHIPIPGSGSVREDLHAFAATVAAYLGDPLGAALARVAVLPVDDPDIAHARATFWNSRIDAAAEMIERGIARGEIPAGADPRTALEALIAPLHSRALITGEPLDDGLPHTLADLVLNGLLPRQ